MDRVAVKSSNLKSVSYDSDTEGLEVEFRTGSVYRYAGVPQAIYEGLMEARSKGSYHHQHIRKTYSYKRLK